MLDEASLRCYAYCEVHIEVWVASSRNVYGSYLAVVVYTRNPTFRKSVVGKIHSWLVFNGQTFSKMLLVCKRKMFFGEYRPTPLSMKTCNARVSQENLSLKNPNQGVAPMFSLYTFLTLCAIKLNIYKSQHFPILRESFPTLYFNINPKANTQSS